MRANEQMQYWYFIMSDLYNWKSQNLRFSDNLRTLINLLDSVLITHQLVWDGGQQLLQILFTTEENERVLMDARKLVLGLDGNPTDNSGLIYQGWTILNINLAEGKERLWVYPQVLMRDFLVANHRPTILIKVSSVQQEITESLPAFSEQIIEAFRPYSPLDPEEIRYGHGLC